MSLSSTILSMLEALGIRRRPRPSQPPRPRIGRRIVNDRQLLTVMARTPPERPWPLYNSRFGPSLPLPGYQWRAIPQRQVDRLVSAGLLAATQADGQPPHVAYWTITDAGRAAIAPTSETQ